MMAQKGSWDALAKMLPCSGCAAGKMRKSHKLKPTDFTELSNVLTKACHHETNGEDQLVTPVFPLSRTAATAEQVTERNKLVARDWGIVNVKSRKGNTVFALYLDVHAGIAFAHCTPSRGEAADTLDACCQTWGIPSELVHDNAVEFLRGTFQLRCRERGIKQPPSPPCAPNYNPSEKYMGIIVSGARSLLFISGLDPQLFWDDAVEHRVQLQLVMALPGRPTPWELALGRRPDLTFIRTTGCEALSQVEKDKRWKFDPKVERCIYLGTSPLHSKDTHKLWNLRAGKELYRRNVYFNERSFPARLDQKITRPLTPAGEVENTDKGGDLIGEEFAGDGETFTVVGTDYKSGTDVLARVNKEGKGFYSTVAEVREWHNATKLAPSACANYGTLKSALPQNDLTSASTPWLTLCA
jgi:hypothetical protein